MSSGNGKNPQLGNGDFWLDCEAKIAMLNGQEVRLAPRPFDVLTFLIENRDRVVSRGELLDTFWNGKEVYDDALRKCVGSIRKALKDERKPWKFIETRYGGGYRFIAPIEPYPQNGNGHKPETETAAFNTSGPHASKAASRKKNRYFYAYAGLITVAVIVILGLSWLATRNNGAAAQPVAGDKPTSPRSIAILPVKNLTGDPANDYFSDGITELIIKELSRANELKVISRSSSFTFKDKNLDPRELGQRLGADLLLEGGFQKKNDTVYVNVRLVNASDGSILWTSSDFQRTFTNAYDLQKEISCNVAAALRTELCGSDMTENHNNGPAYQEYLKGRFEWNKRTGDGIRRSIDHYNRAIALNPNYALAYAGLSESYIQGVWHVPFDPADAVPKARVAGLRALELDESLAEAHTALSSVYGLEWKWNDAEREIGRAIELNPRYARAFHVRAFLLMLRGRFDESVAAIERAEELDPLNMVIAADKGFLLVMANRTDDAFAQWTKALGSDPNFAMVYAHRASVNEWLGKTDAAIDDITAGMKLNNRPDSEITAFANRVKKDGLAAIRRRELSDLLAKKNLRNPGVHVSLAYAYVKTGDFDTALSELEKAFDAKDPYLVLIRSVEFLPVASNPRYLEILAKMGL